MESLNDILEFLKQIPASVLVAGAVLLVIAIYGFRLALKRPPTHLTAFSGDSGSVLVSRKALQELIRQTCLNDHHVDAVRPNVKITGAKVNTRIDLRLVSAENLKETSERIQGKISALLQKSLNFEQIGHIQIVVSSFLKPEEQKDREESSKLPPPSKPGESDFNQPL